MIQERRRSHNACNISQLRLSRHKPNHSITQTEPYILYKIIALPYPIELVANFIEKALRLDLSSSLASPLPCLLDVSTDAPIEIDILGATICIHDSSSARIPSGRIQGLYDSPTYNAPIRQLGLLVG